LVVSVGRKVKSEVPTHGLRQLILLGNIGLTPAVIDLLISKGIETVLLSHHGRYRGRLVGEVSGNIKLRLRQYAVLTDGAFALQTARRIVAGKVTNQRSLLQRFQRRHGTSEALERAVIALRATTESLELAETMDEIRGSEGSASAAYFRVFGKMISAAGFTFEGRNRRPPLDPINALLSLGYTLLSNIVESMVQVVGLDPYLGTLHAATTGRPSLVCDLVEELRAPIVDGLVLAAINRGAFVPEDFEDTGPGEPVLLKRETLRWMITLFERRLDRRITYAATGATSNYRGVIELQARRFARHITGEEPYESFRSR
jgi:CRISPR-associated protein Cas1